MSYNGAGVWTANSTGLPVVTGTTISSTMFNAFTGDVATGLSTALLKDGTQTVTANIPMSAFKLTGLGAATARTDAIQTAQVQDGGQLLIGTVVGTNTITGVLTPVITAYASGQKFVFVPANTNSGATTLNLNGVGAKNVFHNGAACAGGELVQNIPAFVEYDGTQFNIVANGSAVLQGSATAKGDILAATAARAFARLAVGSDGDRLLADSGATPGVSWQTAWFKVGSTTRDTSLASGTQAITGVGFKPKAVILLAGRSAADVSASSIGIDDGTTSQVLTNNNSAAASSFGVLNGSSIYIVQSGTANYSGSITTLGSDGFTITWVKNGLPTGTYNIGYLALR